MSALVSGLVSGGLSLLGGLFSRGEKKKERHDTQREYNRMRTWNTNLSKELAEYVRFDPSELLSAAEASGFNPVTFLNAGGMQAIMGGKQAGAEIRANLGSYTPTPYVSVPSFGSIAVDAAKAGFGAYADAKAVAQSQQFQKDLLGMQLKGNMEAAQVRRASFNVPTLKTAGKAVSLGGAELAASKLAATNPHRVLPIDKTVGDADVYETRYGDVGGVVFGTLNLMDDLIWGPLTGKSSAQRWEMTKNAASAMADAISKPSAPGLSTNWKAPDFAAPYNPLKTLKVETFGTYKSAW
ncbi:DNA pilot protein [Flyfo microvirus Tbat2_112]|nr:DNA pilot protein [Flyfo microvirus Tbat2_112]